MQPAEITPTEAYGIVPFIGVPGPPTDLHDLDGLMRVDLSIQPGVVGEYTLQIIPGPGNTVLTDPIDFVTPLPIDDFTDGSLSITLIPEPASAMLLVLTAPLLIRRLTRVA